MLWYKTKSKVINFFSDIRFYTGGLILFGDSHYEFKGPDMRKALNVLQPGDALLRRYSHYLGTVFIPGYFSHTAVYVGDDKIIHMLGDGINKEDILTFMRCDDLAVLRANKKLSEQAIFRANKHFDGGMEYDFDFDTTTDKRLYCTEFVDNCFGYPIRSEKGRSAKIMPDHFLESKSFSVIWRKQLVL